eukprot:TRINITY_DN33748_c0_g1_i1.p1 TRINITY_DN33748_c0_g1~~TRINITY_DN33748_c0_g1_i1.p1  ORF type:complete len:381 (+),score=62.59 TRINITY_DN33748_c0_g1_i1:100-1242(+)
MDYEDALPTIIVDMGSSELKCGYGGEDAPRKTFKSLLGWPRHPGVGGIMMGAKKDIFVGSDVVENRGRLRISNPVVRGHVSDWGEADKLLHHTFYSELMIAPDEHPLLMMESPGTSRANREKLTELLFETFNTPALVIANQACMSLFASGRSTGTVVDSGDGVSHIVPIWEGYTLPHNIVTMELAGQDITDYLIKLLREQGLPFSTVSDRDIAHDIKETMCYSAIDFNKECENAAISRSYAKHYTMPDGTEIRLVEDRFRCPEAMFNPSLVGKSLPGIHEATHTCIERCDAFVQKEFYKSIILAGGNTLFPKFEDRLAHDVQRLSGDPDKPVKVVAFPERKYSAWLGGSLLASLPTFPTMWLAKKEYDDVGAVAIHKKSF